MRTGYKVLAGAIVILSIVVIAGLYSHMFSGSGGYVVTPAVPSSGSSAGVTPVDAPVVAFTGLPLWVQIAALLDTLLLGIGLFGALPFIAGRIQDVLKNSNRQSIFSYVADNPGCTLAEITDRQNMKNGTVKYHLLTLELEGKIVRRRMGKFTRLYRNAGVNEAEKIVASYLRNETSKGMLQAIADSPGITNQMLSDRFGIDKSSVHWHIERFMKDNLITFNQDGKYKRYFVNESARLALLKLLPADISRNPGSEALTAHT